MEIRRSEFGSLKRREGWEQTGRVTGRGAPLPSRLPGQGPRPGRSAGPGRLSSFLGCDPGVRPAPPPTTMEAEAEGVAETATAAVGEHRIWSRRQARLIVTGFSQWLFPCSTPGYHSDCKGWFRIGGFRPTGRKQPPVSGRSGLVVTPKPPPGLSPPRPVPPLSSPASPLSSPAFGAAAKIAVRLAPFPLVTPRFRGPCLESHGSGELLKRSWRGTGWTLETGRVSWLQPFRKKQKEAG